MLKKTERRRSRSRSRQRIESELAKRVDEAFPLIQATMDYVYNTYGVLKDSNPLLKESLERSEDVAFWMKQKATDVVVATKLDQPLKQLDSAAANSIDKLNDARKQVKLANSHL